MPGAPLAKKAERCQRSAFFYDLRLIFRKSPSQGGTLLAIVSNDQGAGSKK
jgi:hypothetical protein